MRVWVDLTNSPHVLVMHPVIDRLRRRGAEVEVTARDFAQTLGLLAREGMAHTAIGHHRGERLGAKGIGLAQRSLALTRWAHGRDFDLALVVPDAIPPERLRRYGASGKIHAYAGLKEEYYLADFEPDRGVLDELALDPDRPIFVVRTPPEVSLYHRFANDRFAAVLRRLAAAAADGAQPVVLPRTAAQRSELSQVSGFIVPSRAIDAQSLIAYADLVVSAGGTMNREAVALGTPVWTTFEGRLGAVDERLIAEGRLRQLGDVDELPLTARDASAGASAEGRVRRDPELLVDLLLSALPPGR